MCQAFQGSLILSLAYASGAAGQGYAPDVAVGKMRVAEGFEVSLVASEPMIRQPVTMSFDARGRLWVIEYRQYPNPAGLTAVKVDQYLRTKYDKIPDPPPRGPKGLDVVTILEDTDGDGRADAAKEFIGGLNLASGMALAADGVYVAQPPYLLFYPDKDHDDVPDGDPKVILTGFGMEDSHAFVNSLCWGPDGWLYGAQGSTVTANIRGVTFQQGIWRWDPRSDRFELFSEGGGNTWGLDFDPFGNVIAGTNWGGYAMLHQVQGAYHVKGFAKHGELNNPYAFGYFEHVPYKDFRGGHVTCGGIVYQGGAFPEKFNGAYIAANLLSNAIHWHVMERKGSTFTARFGGELVVANDTWFRPVDCELGPDGAVYVADWCDKRANHVDPHDDWDKTNGRIYRIASKGLPRAGKFDLRKMSTPELAKRLENKNVWWARQALTLLRERHDASVAPALNQLATNKTDPVRAIRGAWGLDAVRDREIWKVSLDSPHAAIRAWSVRRLGDDGVVPDDFQDRVTRETDATVRCQWAATAKRLPLDQGMEVVRTLVARDIDAGDPFIPMLCWWAIANRPLSQTRNVVALAEGPLFWKSKIGRNVLAERIARKLLLAAIVADSSSASGVAEAKVYLTECERLFKAIPAGDRDAENRLIEGFEKALVGRRLPETPAAFAPLIASIQQAKKPDVARLRLAVRLGDAESYRRVLGIIADPKADTATRRALVTLMGEVGGADAAPVLVTLLGDPAVVNQAIAALRRYSDDSIAADVLKRLSGLSLGAKGEAIRLLTSRKNWAAALLAKVDAGAIEPKEIATGELRQIALFKDMELDRLTEKHWGKVKQITLGEKSARVHGLNVSLRMAAGNRMVGKEIFTKNCGNCHKLFGEGASVGPELTGADRKNTLFILENVVDPSAVVRKEFLSYNVVVSDGRVLTGLLAESTPTQVTVLDAKNQKTTLPRGEIESIEPSPISLMPEKLLDQLDVQAVRDLFSYLQGEGPVTK